MTSFAAINNCTFSLIKHLQTSSSRFSTTVPLNLKGMSREALVGRIVAVCVREREIPVLFCLSFPPASDSSQDEAFTICLAYLNVAQAILPSSSSFDIGHTHELVLFYFSSKSVQSFENSLRKATAATCVSLRDGSDGYDTLSRAVTLGENRHKRNASP